MMGIAAQRHLLHLPDLARADLENILRLATPAPKALISPEDHAAGDSDNAGG